MEGFHGSLGAKPNPGALSHFGSLEAAAHRLESIFSAQTPRVLTGEGFVTIDRSGQPRSLVQAEDVFKLFGDFMSKAAIHQMSLDIRSPLRLTDCWGDDPIGSGGMALFEGSADLSPAKRKSLRELFQPFSGVIYPDQITAAIRSRQISIRALEQQLLQSSIFKVELKKRQDRLGDRLYKEDRPYEVVWTALTQRLRKWALSNGYDSFVYHNKNEGQGDCHVVLKQEQVQSVIKAYAFDRDKFNDLIPQAVQGLRARFQASARQGGSFNTITDAFLHGMNVEALWKPERLVEVKPA